MSASSPSSPTVLPLRKQRTTPSKYRTASGPAPGPDAAARKARPRTHQAPPPLRLPAAAASSESESEAETVITFKDGFTREEMQQARTAREAKEEEARRKQLASRASAEAVAKEKKEKAELAARAAHEHAQRTAREEWQRQQAQRDQEDLELYLALQAKRRVKEADEMEESDDDNAKRNRRDEERALLRVKQEYARRREDDRGGQAAAGSPVESLPHTDVEEASETEDSLSPIFSAEHLRQPSREYFDRIDAENEQEAHVAAERRRYEAIRNDEFIAAAAAHRQGRPVPRPPTGGWDADGMPNILDSDKAVKARMRERFKCALFASYINRNGHLAKRANNEVWPLVIADLRSWSVEVCVWDKIGTVLTIATLLTTSLPLACFLFLWSCVAAFCSPSSVVRRRGFLLALFSLVSSILSYSYVSFLMSLFSFLLSSGIPLVSSFLSTLFCSLSCLVSWLVFLVSSLYSLVSLASLSA